jgi:caa(3)-type oxidase subunit IV
MNETADPSLPAEHVAPVRVDAWTLVALLSLTAATAAASRVHLAHGALWVALVFALAKASLVLTVFMHLRWDARVLRAVLALAIFLVGTLFGLSFLDLSSRDSALAGTRALRASTPALQRSAAVQRRRGATNELE